MTFSSHDDMTLPSRDSVSADNRLIDADESEPIVRRVARHLVGRQTIRPGRAVLRCFMGMLLAFSLVGLPLAGSFGVAGASAPDEKAQLSLTSAPTALPLRDALLRANFAGRDYVLQYLDGIALTPAAAHAVDVRALQAINPEFAFEFEEYVLGLDGEEESETVGPVVPAAPDSSDTVEDAEPPADDPAPTPDPETPSDPSGETGDPEAGSPDAPSTPDDPSIPVIPVDPAPDTPANPDDPSTPDAPADPDTPDTPENPDAPDAPADPTPPTEEGGPINPETETPVPGTGPVTDSSTSSSIPNASSTGSHPQWSYQGDTTYKAHHYTHDLTTEKFIAVIGEQARQIGQERNIYASVMIAQAILESGSGNSSLARAPYNNLFGIKGSFNGKSVSMSTLEDDGTGAHYSIVAPFRSYDSIMDSLNDYADLIRTGLSGYYRAVWKEHAATFVEACNYLEGHYATDTSYSEKLQDLIETYDLTRFDTPLDYEPVVPITVQMVDEETNRPIYDGDGNPVLEERTLADLVAEATCHLGTDYLWGGTSPERGFDCSGLVQYSYAHALGINLPRTTYYQCLVGEDVDFDDLHMGDLLFFARGDDVHHVAMYLGDGYYIEAPAPGDVVKVTAMEERMPSFAKRVIPTKDADHIQTSPLLQWPSERLTIDA